MTKVCQRLVLSLPVLGAMLLLPMLTFGQEEPADEMAVDQQAIATQLDETRTEIFKLFNQEQYSEIADQYCHEDITCVWSDGTTSKGRQGVTQFFAKLKEFIDVMQVNPSTTDRSVYEGGKYVVSIGELGDTYQMASGKEFDLNSGWMATLVYEEGKWQLISFAVSTNAFENQVIDGLLFMRTIVAGLSGLVGGVILLWILRRKKPTA